MPAPPSDLHAVVRAALAEDLGSGDITALLVDESANAEARIIAREAGVLCGIPWVDAVYAELEPRVILQWQLAEGAAFATGEVLLRLRGPTRAIVSGERTALNFLQTLCGTATRSRHHAELVAHTPLRVLDTRKTLPGLRSAQKYAVAIGGCHNHRMGLYDGCLIKENHIRAGGGIGVVVAKARKLLPGRSVQVEVRDLAQLEQALEAGADLILLDNFDLPGVRKAVALNASRAGLEASGNVDESNLVKLAETGVDSVSVGALTKHCHAIDLSLLLD